MMRVLLDVSILGLGVLYREARGGAYRVAEHLVEDLHASGECHLSLCANHSSIALDGTLQFLRRHPALARVAVTGESRGLRAAVRRSLTGVYRRARTLLPPGDLPAVLRRVGEAVDRRVVTRGGSHSGTFHILHSLMHPLPPRGRDRMPQRFLTIYDIRHRRLPHLYNERSSAAGETALRSVDARDWVVTSSEASRADLIETGLVRPDQIFVIPLSADSRLFYPSSDPEALRVAKKRYGIGDAPYIFCVGGIDARKNTDVAVRAFSRVVREARLTDVQLVIAGVVDRRSPAGAAAQEASKAGARVVQTGFIEDEDLAVLYSGARAFVFPSLYEGFGLPPLEAMQCGTPVIVSNASSLPEVVGDAGILVPPDDADALARAMMELIRDDRLRDSRAAASILRARQFSRERTARAVLDAYRVALDSVPPAP